MNITPQHPGESGALVPVDGADASNEKDRKDFYCDVDLTKFLLELWNKHHQMHESEWSHLKRSMIRARNYYDGRQYGYVNNHFQWIDYEKRPGEVNYVANVTQYHVQTILMEVSRGRTQLAFSHVNNESREGQLIARIAEQRFKTHKRRTFDASKEQQENLSWILNGLTIRYTYPVFKKGKGKRPIFNEEEVTGDESTVVCAECSSPMDVDGPNECEHCGNTETREITAGSMRVKKIAGYEETTFCETEWMPVDPLGITFYLHASCVEETPFILWEQQVFKDVLEAKYPTRKIQDGITSDALRYKMDSATQTPNVDGLLGDGGNTQGLAQLDQGWFDVELYGHKVVQSETTLRNGTVIPAGTKLGKVFPNGLFLAKNANTILDLFGENKNDKFTIAPYVSRVGTMIGAGMSVALSNQDTKNDLRNLHMQSIMNDAFRKEFINPQFIDPDAIPNDPTERGVLHNTPPGSGRILGTAIDVMPPSPLSGDAYQIEERIDGEIQAQLGTFAGNSVGAPDLKAVQDTAAGMQMWREMTVGRFFPMLATKADALDKEQAYQFLLNDQKYLSQEQWQELKGDYGEEALKLFLNCDLRKELVIEVVPESFMPASTAQKQANIMGWTQFIMNTQTPPNSELGAYVAEQFSIPKQIIGHDAHYAVATAMIGAFKTQADQVIAEFGDVPSFDLQDPMIATLAALVVEEAKAPFDAEMNDPNIITDALKDWWVKDTGRASSNLLKAAVLFRMAEIKGKMVIKAQQDQMYAMAAQEPQMQMQQEQAAQQQAMQAEQQAMQAEQQMAQQEAQNAREDEKWERDMQARTVEKLVDIEQKDKERAEQAARENNVVTVSGS